MKDMLIIDGRLAWPPLLAFILLCAGGVVFDLLWRTLTVSFEALVLGAGLAVLLGMALLAVLGRALRRRRAG